MWDLDSMRRNIICIATRQGRGLAALKLFLLLPLCLTAALATRGGIQVDAAHGHITLSDAAHNLVLRLDYDHKCIIDQVSLSGRQVVREQAGVCSAIKMANQWFTTRDGIPTPEVVVTNNVVNITAIRFGPPAREISHTCRLTAQNPDTVR